jgi:hypothetical protein
VVLALQNGPRAPGHRRVRAPSGTVSVVLVALCLLPQPRAKRCRLRLAYDRRPEVLLLPQ